MNFSSARPCSCKGKVLVGNDNPQPYQPGYAEAVAKTAAYAADTANREARQQAAYYAAQQAQASANSYSAAMAAQAAARNAAALNAATQAAASAKSYSDYMATQAMLAQTASKTQDKADTFNFTPPSPNNKAVVTLPDGSTTVISNPNGIPVVQNTPKAQAGDTSVIMLTGAAVIAALLLLK